MPRNSGERTPLTCPFESLAVASRPLQRLTAETMLVSRQLQQRPGETLDRKGVKVRDGEVTIASTQAACAPQTRRD